MMSRGAARIWPRAIFSSSRFPCSFAAVAARFRTILSNATAPTSASRVSNLDRDSRSALLSGKSGRLKASSLFSGGLASRAPPRRGAFSTTLGRPQAGSSPRSSAARAAAWAASSGSSSCVKA